MKNERIHLKALKLGGVEEMILDLKERAAKHRLAAPRQEDAKARHDEESRAVRLENAASIAQHYLELQQSPADKKASPRTSLDIDEERTWRLSQRMLREEARAKREAANPPHIRQDPPRCTRWVVRKQDGKTYNIEAFRLRHAKQRCLDKGWTFIGRAPGE